MAHVGLSFGAAASQWHSVGSGLPRSVFRVPVRRAAWLPGWACASQAEGPAFGLIAPVSRGPLLSDCGLNGAASPWFR
jgi:hypothetical protein